MRKIILAVSVITIVINLSYAQYLGIPDNSSKDAQNSNLFLGLINLNKFTWSNTFNMSYGSFSGASYSLASYTGTLSYKMRDNMNLSADITMQYSPFANLGAGSTSAANRSFQDYLSGVNISRVSFNWQPFKNLYVNFEYLNPKSNYGFDNFYYPHYFGY